MAVSDLTTEDGLQKAAENGRDIIDVMTKMLLESTGKAEVVDAVIIKLERYKEALAGEEKALLEKFKVNSESALQQLFINFYSDSGLINLSGSELERTILDDYQSNLKENVAEIKQFMEQRVIPQMAGIAVNTAAEEGVKILAQQFNSILNGLSVKVTDKGGEPVFKKNVSSARPISFDGKHWSVLASKLTEAQKRRMLAIMEQEGFLASKKKINFDTTTSNNGIITDINFNWFDITSNEAGEAIKASEAKIRWKPGDPELINRNNHIASLIASKVNSNYSSMVYNYINNYILKSDPYAFFVGGNVKGITGIVGEISAVVAIGNLLKGVNVDKIMTWVANHRVNKKELSIDILLKDLAGIQVKNTSKDFGQIPELRIDFADASASTLLSRLESAYDIEFTHLETVFESEAFNVPAATGKGGKFREVGIDFNYSRKVPSRWDAFTKAYNKMQDVIFDVKQFMSAFAPDFLFMSGGDKFENQLANLDAALDGATNAAGYARANTLYLVAGVPFFASSMLDTIENNLKELQDLKDASRVFDIQSSLGSYLEGKTKVPYNYVAYRNNMGGDVAARHVKLTSSYGFKHL